MDQYSMQGPADGRVPFRMCASKRARLEGSRLEKSHDMEQRSIKKQQLSGAFSCGGVLVDKPYAVTGPSERLLTNKCKEVGMAAHPCQRLSAASTSSLVCLCCPEFAHKWTLSFIMDRHGMTSLLKLAPAALKTDR